MKRCPTCNRFFDDETLSFCLEDGTPLERDSGSRGDSQATLVSSTPLTLPPDSGGLAATQTYGQLGGKATINASQFNAPAPQPYLPAPKQRRTWPWIVAALAIILLVIGGIAAAVFIPQVLRNSGNDNRAQPTPAASPAAVGDDVPNNEDEILAQLTKLEDEWARANVRGDKQALERILADEYVGGSNSHSKREYIDSLSPDLSVKSWELKDVTVDHEEDKATVKGTLTEETKTGTVSSEFTDKFVWRNRRWQAVSSVTTLEK